MTKTNIPQLKFVNAETGEEIVRDATAEEIIQMEIETTNAEARKQAKAQASAQRLALLSRFGITEEEARILLGGN